MKLNKNNFFCLHIPFWVLLQLILCIIMIVLKFQAYQYASVVCLKGICRPNLPYGVQEAASSNLATPTSKKVLRNQYFFFVFGLFLHA